MDLATRGLDDLRAFARWCDYCLDAEQFMDVHDAAFRDLSGR